jgi:two-component system sensor histidine kinase BaeS
MQLGVVEPTTARIASLNDELIRLTSLVRELQEIGLAEAGELQLNLATENLTDLLNDLKLIFEPEAEAKGIQLIFSYPNLQVTVDKNRLRQVLINIIANALRYTENGFIELNVEESPENLLFTITNTGPQIQEDDLEHLFDRFYKADAARTRGKSGSGLGLAIAKAYVEAHEGQISVRNVSDGVQFSFSISKHIAKTSQVTLDN